MTLSFPKLPRAALLGVPAAALALAWSAAPRGDTPAPPPLAAGNADHPTGSRAAAAARAPATATAALLPISGQPTVEPRLPPASGTPCIVEIDDALDNGFGTYTPPTACRGPWSKVLLKLNLTGGRNTAAAIVRLDMDGVPLFWGAPQEHDGIPVWHLERDLTDDAAWLRAPRDVEITYEVDNAPLYEDPPPPMTGTVRLVFFPATAATPAQHVPDVVRPVLDRVTLPRNIERAYLDVYARAIEPDRAWYSCLPQGIATKWPALSSPFAMGDTPFSVFGWITQSCGASSFREIQVRIDGHLAGIAPLFPWLPSDIGHALRNAVDQPAPSVQALNLTPYRVDLTPFAALLNDGHPHAITIAGVGGTGVRPVATSGQLLLYLDHGKAHLGGALTRNTLASTPAPLTIESTLARSGDVLQGGIATRKDRSFVIQGYVDTSHGRIHSTVSATVHFGNVQQFRIDGLTYPAWHGYRQQLQLASTADRISRRRLGTQVIQEDREHVGYPLALDYRATGGISSGSGDEGDHAFFTSGSVTVSQGRHLARSDDRPGMPRYAIAMHDTFDGSHARNYVQDTSSWRDTNWRSTRRYLFKDDAGSCYSAALATANGTPTTGALGAACDGRNVMRWFAHVDGSADSLGWAPAVP